MRRRGFHLLQILARRLTSLSDLHSSRYLLSCCDLTDAQVGTVRAALKKIIRKVVPFFERRLDEVDVSCTTADQIALFMKAPMHNDGFSVVKKVDHDKPGPGMLPRNQLRVRLRLPFLLLRDSDGLLCMCQFAALSKHVSMCMNFFRRCPLEFRNRLVETALIGGEGIDQQERKR
jgi:hypothetical protein